jgi:outer membrane protein assembly factor BamB
MNPMSSTSRLAVALAASALTAATTTAQNDWPMFQANARHDGYLPVSIDVGRLALSWRTRLGEATLNPVTAADSRVYASGYAKRLWVLDAATGELEWTRAYQSAHSVNPPSFADGKVYMQTGNHSSDTYLRCFDAETGDLLFEAPHSAQWEEYWAPTIVDGAVYVNGGSYGGMYSFDAATGRQRWFAQLAQYDEWTPAVDETYAYAYVGGTLSALDKATGIAAFTIDDPDFDWLGWSMQLAPVLGGQDDAIVVHDGRLVRFDLAGRRVAINIDGGFTGQPAVKDGVIYVISSGLLQARSQTDGSLLWAWERSSQNMSGVVSVTDSHAFVSSSTHTYAIDLTTHQSAWSVERSGRLTVAQGAIYIAERDGHLSSYRWANLPEPRSIAPARHHYATPPETVRINGENFTGNGDISVWFGGEAATDVVVRDDRTVECRPPASGPGRVDVTVGNLLGRRRLDDGFTYIPATEPSGDYRIGGRIRIEYACETGDQILGLIGIHSAGMALPPFIGELALDPVLPLVAVPFTFGDTFILQLDIPRDASLRGGRVAFQALVGPELRGGQPVAGAFTNTPGIEIR